MTDIKKAICSGMLASILLLGGCSQKESPFQSFFNGDFSLLCPSEAYDAEAVERIAHDLSTADFVYEEMDVSGDGEKELLVKSPNDPAVVRGVFHHGEAGIQCWLWDTDERCVWTLEKDGVFLRRSKGVEEVSEWRICFDADGQQGVVVDVGGDVPRLVVFSSFAYKDGTDPLRHFDTGMRTLTIYKMDDRQSPIQTLTTDTSIEANMMGLEDLNFDGYLDITYVRTIGNVNTFLNVFLWDTEQGVFCENEALEQLPNLSVEENEVISSWSRGSASSGTQEYYRYIDGQLTCIRSIEHDWYGGGGFFEDRQPFLSVKDYQDGELKTVFYETVPFESLSETADGGVIWPWPNDQRREEWNKWNDDLNYHGE